MSSDPSYPKDTPVGDGKAGETTGAADDTQGAGTAADKGDKAKGNNRWLVRGAAVGVGSAALVAALLYANRSRRSGSGSGGSGSGPTGSGSDKA